jgi:hypothetical protein
MVPGFGGAGVLDELHPDVRISNTPKKERKTARDDSIRIRYPFRDGRTECALSEEFNNNRAPESSRGLAGTPSLEVVAARALQLRGCRRNTGLHTRVPVGKLP